MLKLVPSSCSQGRLQNLRSRFPDGVANGRLQKRSLFRVFGSLRSSIGDKTLLWQKTLYSSESGKGDGDVDSSVDAKAADEAEYASTGADAEDAKASSAIVPTTPRPEDHLTVCAILLC